MDKKDIFNHLRQCTSNDFLLKEMNNELDSIRDRVLILIREYKERKKLYNIEFKNQKFVKEYIDKLEESSNSVQ